jgi:Ssp1 endopeptidase immunity protein Rap1a
LMVTSAADEATTRTAGVFVLVFAVLLLTTSPAFAESAEEILSSCVPLADAAISGDKESVPARSEQCWDAFGTLQKAIAFAGDSGRLIFGVCAPPGSKRIQLISAFVDYARRNPQRLHEDFRDVATDALSAAFPCQSR